MSKRKDSKREQSLRGEIEALQARNAELEAARLAIGDHALSLGAHAQQLADLVQRQTNQITQLQDVCGRLEQRNARLGQVISISAEGMAIERDELESRAARLQMRIHAFEL